jgi:hypothetical protein
VFVILACTRYDHRGLELGSRIVVESCDVGIDHLSHESVLCLQDMFANLFFCPIVLQAADLVEIVLIAIKLVPFPAFSFGPTC